jgi:hypothetical protein
VKENHPLQGLYRFSPIPNSYNTLGDLLSLIKQPASLQQIGFGHRRAARSIDAPVVLRAPVRGAGHPYRCCEHVARSWQDSSRNLARCGSLLAIHGASKTEVPTAKDSELIANLLSYRVNREIGIPVNQDTAGMCFAYACSPILTIVDCSPHGSPHGPAGTARGYATKYPHAKRHAG